MIEGGMKRDKQGTHGPWLSRDYLTSPPRGHSSFQLTSAASPRHESCCCLAEMVSSKALIRKDSWIAKLPPVLLCLSRRGSWSGDPFLLFAHPWCIP